MPEKELKEKKLADSYDRVIFKGEGEKLLSYPDREPESEKEVFADLADKANKDEVDTHVSNTDIHFEKSDVTKSDVGLSNVDNVKQATKTEFDTHVANGNIHFEKSDVSKGDVGLGNVNNIEQAPKAGDNTQTFLVDTATENNHAVTKAQHDNKANQSDLNTHTENNDIHREINDAGAGETDLWSANKINAELASKSGGDDFDASGDYENLRARGTTKEDVGLDNVNNTEQAPKAGDSQQTFAVASPTDNAHSVNRSHARSNFKGVIVHGNDPNVPRPPGYTSVEWIGGVEPNNMANNDTWVDTS